MQKPEMPKLGTKEGWASIRAQACAKAAAGILEASKATCETPAPPRDLAVAKKWLREALEALEEIGVPEWEAFLESEYKKRLVAEPVDAAGSNPATPVGSTPTRPT